MPYLVVPVKLHASLALLAPKSILPEDVRGCLLNSERALQGNPPAWGLVRHLNLLPSLPAAVAYTSPVVAPLLWIQGRLGSRGHEHTRCVLVWQHVSRLTGPLPLVGGILVPPAPSVARTFWYYRRDWVECHQWRRSDDRRNM